MANTTVGFFKLSALPAAPYQPNAVYMIPDGADGVTFYVADNTGATVKHTPTLADIDAAIVQALKNQDIVKIVADITARDALAADFKTYGEVRQVLVKDATGDPTVATGAATYVFDPSGAGSWYKIAEHALMDLATSWNAIVGRPTSSAGDIDDAVAKRHSHTNLADLNKLSTGVNNELYVNGKQVEAALTTAQW